jgi:signal transduction histidine kinase
LINWLIKEQKSILIEDTELDPAWEVRPGAEHVRNWLGVPVIAAGRTIGIYSLDKVVSNFFTQEHVQLTESLVGQAGVAIQNAWLFEQVRSGRERLQSLSRQLVEIQETERRYIARELHDEAGQSLTSLMVGLRLLEREANHPEALFSAIGDLKNMVDTILENLHRLAVDLRPASLDHLGLIAALQQYIESICDKHAITIQFETLDITARLPQEMETALYRIVQEGITNAIRHSQATRIDVLLEKRDDKIITIVEDNGIGFDPLTVMRGDRLGLFGIRERAEMLGGSLIIESSHGNGCTILVEVPYAN